MVQFATFSESDRHIVNAIVERAVNAGIYDDPLSTDMDLSATHVHCPLDLSQLLTSDDFNFAHDMIGIKQHLNRKTGKLEGFFLPRFALPQNEGA